MPGKTIHEPTRNVFSCPFSVISWIVPAQEKDHTKAIPDITLKSDRASRSCRQGCLRSIRAAQRNCLGGGGFCVSSEEPFSPVSENISLMLPTAECMLDVSTGMKITFALLLLVMSRRLSM